MISSQNLFSHGAQQNSMRSIAVDRGNFSLQTCICPVLGSKPCSRLLIHPLEHIQLISLLVYLDTVLGGYHTSEISIHLFEK